jgi:ParB family chromosome partitioning protein
MIQSIPLNKLVPSSRNVRRDIVEHAELQLKADIEARGLLQNLVVSRRTKPKGSFAVEAGGRRLRALQGLAEEGKIAKTHEVSCLVLEGDPADAQEASLAENFQRLAMNPADECLAFQQLIEQGADVDGIARRFGLTARFVEGRLRLANLAPALFDALGAGEISLEVAKAYAATPDRERQEYVFEQMGKGYGYAHPDSIRRMMTQATVSAGDRRARFVGEEAYVAAGGRVERDLFDDESETRWLDVAILERLAGEKMETLAAEAAAQSGLGWVRPTLEGWIGYAHTEGLRRVSLDTPPPTDAESGEVDELDAQIADCVAILEDEESSDDAREKAEARVRDLSCRIDAIVNKAPVVPEDLKPQVGAFLTLDDEGHPKLDTGLYAEISLDGDSPDMAEGGDDRQSAAASGRPKGLSQRLVDELAMQRRDILAAHIEADPGLAIDLAIFLMIDTEAGSSSERSGSSLRAIPPANPVFDFETPDASATRAGAEADQALDRGWTGGPSRAARFDAFRTLSEGSRAAWLGHAVARTLDASLNLAGDRACAFHDHLGRLLGIEVARWWRPTGANYFDRVPKSLALAALSEVGGPEFAGRYANAKKAELAQSCERIFAGDFIGDADVKEAALAWVPDAMRFADPLSPTLEASDAGIDPGDPQNEPRGPDVQDARDPAGQAVEEAA